MWGRQTIDESTMKSHLKWEMPCSVSFKYLLRKEQVALKNTFYYLQKHYNDLKIYLRFVFPVQYC